MAEQLESTSYAHALRRYEASWWFADAELRRAVGLWAISTAWNTYRRDAGLGEVGPAHEKHAEVSSVLRVDDPRRDAVLLWLLDHGTAEIAEAARTLICMALATRRFNTGQNDLLHEARDATSSAHDGPIALRIAEAGLGAQVTAPLVSVASAIDRLRGSETFLEGMGESVSPAVPSGTFSHYVPAPAGATWGLIWPCFRRHRR